MNPVQKMADNAKEQKEYYEYALKKDMNSAIGLSRVQCVDTAAYYRGKQEAFEMMAEMVEKQK